MIDLFPPAAGAGKKFDLFTFRNGRTARAEGGIMKCVDRAEAEELLAEGWTARVDKIAFDDLQKVLRTEALHSGVVPIAADKINDDALLMRAAESTLRHQGGARRRVVIGELDLGRVIGRVHAEIEGADITLDGATTFNLLDDIDDPDLAAALLRASGAFVDALQDADEQTIARTTIAALVQAVLQQHQHIADAVISQKLKQRSA